MKTADLTGALLDYWVARADGAGTDTAKMKDGDKWCAIEMVPNAMKPFPACILGHKVGRGKHPYRSEWFYPSTVWQQGGPIVERERIKLMPTIPSGATWYATISKGGSLKEMQVWRGQADKPLLAAMRAYVASKFGDTVPDDGAAAQAAGGQQP